MTRRERQLVILLTIVVALTRLLAISHSMWDWDEPLFCTALHQFDVAAHHPHPPGFPLYIGLARLMRLLIHDDFHALRAISLLSAFGLFPVMVALGRAMRFPFHVAVFAALLFVFLPNVWFYGGTAFSDIFNVLLLLAGLALLFASRDGDRKQYLAGTVVFALSLLVRPQNVLSVYPWLTATWARVKAKRFGEIAMSATLAVVILAIGYGAAAWATGFHAYVDAVSKHGHYIARFDGYGNPVRPTVLMTFPLFGIDPFGGGKAPRILFAFAVLGIVIPGKRDIEVLATFMPVLVLAMFLLSTTGASRLAIGYMPMHALLAADGIARVASGVTRLVGRERPLLSGQRARSILELAVQAICVSVIAGRFIYWMLPGLRAVRTTNSPPVQAVTWVRRNVPAGVKLLVQGSLEPFADYYLGGHDVRLREGGAEVAVSPRGWYVGDGPTSAPDAVRFVRARNPLWAVSDQRYFETYVLPTNLVVDFREGWSWEEKADWRIWRWMGRRGVALLPPLGGRAYLSIRFFVPLDALHARPNLTIAFNGVVIDRFPAMATDIQRSYEVATRAATPNELVMETDQIVNPAAEHLSPDTRDLGLQLRGIDWAVGK
jgi:hypothetical protein